MLDMGELLLTVWLAAGLPMPQRWRGEKAPDVLCPLHEDHRPSGWIDLKRGIFGCSVCGTFTAKALAERFGVPWPPQSGIPRSPRIRVKTMAKDVPGFTPADASRAWDIAVARVRDDDAIQVDAPAYNFLRRRGLSEAWEERPHLFGILGPQRDERLPKSIRWWGPAGYLLVVPLYVAKGADAGMLVNIQARHVEDRPLSDDAKKKLFPSGSRAAGAVFANTSALEVLRGERGGERVVIGEGLTDYLTLATFVGGPVLAVPGAGQAAAAIGPWVRRREIVLMFDADDAGLRATDEAARAIERHAGKVLVWSRLEDVRSAS